MPAASELVWIASRKASSGIVGESLNWSDVFPMNGRKYRWMVSSARPRSRVVATTHPMVLPLVGMRLSFANWLPYTEARNRQNAARGCNHSGIRDVRYAALRVRRQFLEQAALCGWHRSGKSQSLRLQHYAQGHQRRNHLELHTQQNRSTQDRKSTRLNS